MPLNHDPNDETWEGEYWDDFTSEFGVPAYLEVRYAEVPLASVAVAPRDERGEVPGLLF